MSRTRALTSGIAIIVSFGWSSVITNSMLGLETAWACARAPPAGAPGKP
jgi:hypothetical protein